MTREEGNLVGELVNVGSIVATNQVMENVYRYSTNQRFTIRPEDRLEVTRVYRDNLLVRTLATREIPNGWGPQESSRISVYLSREVLIFEDPNYVPPPPPRKLGTMPEGEGLIGIDHPGIQWLFDDMGQYADEQGYCDQYDRLCVKLGIPGRPRNFTVRRTIGGLEVSATVRARSQREASEALDAAMMSGTTRPTEKEEGTDDH